MVENFFKILPVNTEENDYVIVCGNVQASKEHFKNIVVDDKNLHNVL